MTTKGDRGKKSSSSPSQDQLKKSRSSAEPSPKTAHDWRKYEKTVTNQGDALSPVEVEFFDDGTVTFFW